MMGITRLLFVGGLAVVGFVVALFAFKEVPFSECQADATRDPSYHVVLEPNPPTIDTMNYQLKVTHKGEPVTGAQVCMRADMGGAGNMSGMGTSAIAKETAPGRYDVMIRFEMSGHWDTHVMLRKPGQTPIDIPFGVEAE